MERERNLSLIFAERERKIGLNFADTDLNFADTERKIRKISLIFAETERKISLNLAETEKILSLILTETGSKIKTTKGILKIAINEEISLWLRVKKEKIAINLKLKGWGFF